MKLRSFFFRICVIVSAVLLRGTLLHAQGPLYDYTVNNGLYFGDMCVAASGNCYLASYNQLTCFSPSGTILWTSALQQPNLGIVRVFETSNEIVIAGVININPNGAFVLLKLDANQNLLWMHEYAWSTNMYPALRDAIMTSDGEFVLAGSSGNSNYIFKTNSTGNLIWARSNNGSFGFTALAESDDHHLLVGCGNATVIKMDTAGAMVWQHAYTPQSANGSGSVTGIADTPGGYLFTGNCGNNAVMIVRTDFNGNLLYGSSFADSTSWVIQSSRATEIRDSGIVMVLSHYQNFSGGDMHGGIAYVDTAGSLRWAREYTTMWSVTGAQPDGMNYVVLGCSELITSRYALMKTNSNGTGLCSGTIVPLVHGVSVIDTSFNYLLSVASVPDTQIAFVQLMADTIGVLGNCGPLGIEPAAESKPRVFPNPCDGFGFYLYNLTGPTDVRVYDATGRLILSKTVQQGDNSVTFTHRLTAGMYLVNLHAESGVTTRRLVVEY